MCGQRVFSSKCKLQFLSSEKKKKISTTSEETGREGDRRAQQRSMEIDNEHGGFPRIAGITPRTRRRSTTSEELGVQHGHPTNSPKWVGWGGGGQLPFPTWAVCHETTRSGIKDTCHLRTLKLGLHSLKSGSEPPPSHKKKHVILKTII